MTPRRWVALPAALLIVLGGTSCSVGSSDSAASTPPSSSLPSVTPNTDALSPHDMRDARQELLPANALPGLQSRARTLDVADFVSEADDLRVTNRVAADGLQGAVERTFRGKSRSITGAESRVLVFESAAGAASFARFLSRHPGPFFGAPSTAEHVRFGEYAGYLIEPPACDCPGAYPLHVAVMAANRHLMWLQLTGPRSTPARLRELVRSEN